MRRVHFGLEYWSVFTDRLSGHQTYAVLDLRTVSNNGAQFEFEPALVIKFVLATWTET